MSLLWPWHFVSVSEAEKQHRRELLTLRGYYAQLYILLALVLLRLYTAFFPPDKRRRPTKGSRQKSWLDLPLFTGWFETRRQYLFCLIWLSWLLGLSVWSTGDDYLHLTKALGHVGLSQLPLQVAMSPALYITSTPRASSLVSVLTSIPQPTVTAYHRLFARVVISPLLVGHAILYCLFFLQSSHPGFSSLFAKRILDLDVQLGTAAVTMASAAMIFVRPRGATGGIWKGTVKDRRRAFFVVHLLLVGVLCLAAYFHVAQAQVFVLESVVAFLLNLGCCFMTVQ
ncbi:rerric reductase like transmembrane component [Aspergillus cavernicola]|uniref:Rerric reductase like transmembrane component n=1 Tax=Aspergillus cavernicola TaxID=176166 RepID=A0ABR4IJ61_9EURO